MSEPDLSAPRSANEQAAAISSLLVQTCVEYLGRGPTKARTSISADVITVVLDDSMTRAEKALISGGHAAKVIDGRRAFQGLMAPDLIRGVERITGRQVLAFLSDSHIDPDIAVETFVLRSLGQELPTEQVPDVNVRGPSR